MNKKQKEIIEKVNEVLDKQFGNELYIHEVRDESDNSLIGYNCCYEWNSDLGEDLYEEFDIPKNFNMRDIWNAFYSIYYNFDVDDHVEPLVSMRGKNGVPSSIKALVDDAEMIENTYKEIADAINELI